MVGGVHGWQGSCSSAGPFHVKRAKPVQLTSCQRRSTRRAPLRVGAAGLFIDAPMSLQRRVVLIRLSMMKIGVYPSLPLLGLATSQAVRGHEPTSDMGPYPETSVNLNGLVRRDREWCCTH